MYVAGAILTIFMSGFLFEYSGAMVGVKEYTYSAILQPVFGDMLGSLVFALLFIGINWLIGYRLYKKKIYIKI